MGSVCLLLTKFWLMQALKRREIICNSCTLLMCPTQTAPRPDCCILLELTVLQQAFCPPWALWIMVNVSLVTALHHHRVVRPYFCFASVDSLSYWGIESYLGTAMCAAHALATLLWEQSITSNRVARRFWSRRVVHKLWGYWWNTVHPRLQVNSSWIVKALCCTNLILFRKAKINRFKVLTWSLLSMKNMMVYTTIYLTCLDWVFVEKKFCVGEFFLLCIRQKLNHIILSSCLALVLTFYAPVTMWEKG